MGDQKHRKLNKWCVLGLLWFVQAAIAYVVWIVWIMQGESVDPATPFGTFVPREYIQVATDLDFLFYFIFWASLFTILQGLFLFPVRKPCAIAKRGTSVWVSLSIAGLLMVAMALALVFAFESALRLMFGDNGLSDWDPHPAAWISMLVVSWVFFTALLIRFCRATPRETMLSRLASRLFLGTIVEVAAIIPLDIMIRRKTDCYCFGGSYFALSICGTIGLFIAGPAVILVLLCKRRKRWYRGRCDACGYDMSGCVDAERCPECGTGWRPANVTQS